MDFSLGKRKLASRDRRFQAEFSPSRQKRGTHCWLIFAVLAALLFVTLVIPSGYAATNDTVSITVTCSPNPILYGGTTSCTVTLTDTAPTPNNGAPQGTVSFTVSPTGGTFSPSTSCTLATSGAETSTCSATYSPASSGAKTITGLYNRLNNNWIGGGTGSATLTVTGRTTSTSVS